MPSSSRRSARALAVALFGLFAALPILEAQWAGALGGPGSDVASQARPTSDGGIITAGFTTSSGAGGEDLWVVKLDAAGAVLWSRAYGGPADERAYVILETPDGYIVLGWTESFGAGGRDAWILKLDSGGVVQWQRTYGGQGFDQGDDIRATPDGGYIAACFTQSFGSGQEDFWLLKLDASGTIQWQRVLGGTGSDLVEHVETTSDGGYLVTGFTQSFGAGRNDAWVLKLSAAGGVVWQKKLGGAGDDFPEYLEKTSDGGFVIAGASDSSGAGGYDILVLKFDSSGALQWQRTYGGSGTDYAEAIRQTSDGGYVVGGHTDSFGAGGTDVWVIRLDPSGGLVWQRTYGGPREDLAYSLQLLPSGDGMIVAGATLSFGSGLDDLFLLRIAPDGRIAPVCSVGAASSVSSGFSNLTSSAASGNPIDPGLAGRASTSVPIAAQAAFATICRTPRLTLLLSAGPGGTTDPSPGAYPLDFMSEVQVRASPSGGFVFDSWTGDVAAASRLTNPLSIVLDSDKAIRANFRPSVSPPLNLTGRRLGRAVGTSAARIDSLTWEPNPANAGAAVVLYRVYRIDAGIRTLLAELPSGARAFVRAGVPANAVVIYAVTAVTAADDESVAATVTIGPRAPASSRGAPAL